MKQYVEPKAPNIIGTNKFAFLQDDDDADSSFDKES